MGQVQDEGGDVGSPEGLKGIAWASCGAVLLEAGQQGRVVQARENGGKLAEVVLRGCAIMRWSHLELSLPCGRSRQVTTLAVSLFRVYIIPLYAHKF